MKKILAIILMLVCVFSVTACGSISAEEAEAIAKTFLDGVTNLDADMIKTAIDDPAKAGEFTEFDTKLDELKSTMPETTKPYEENINKLFDAVVEKVKSEMSYTIKETKVEGDKAIVTVDVVMPDFDKFDGAALLSGITDQSAIATLMQKLLLEGKLTQSMSQEDMMALLIPALIDSVAESIDSVEFESTTKTVDLTVYEKDGVLVIKTSEIALF